MKQKRNRTLTERILSTFLTVCLIVSLMPAAAFAEADGQPVDQMIYLALGDSISAGYGLGGLEVNKDGEENFVNQVALGIEADLVYNEAVNGNTAAGILAQIGAGNLDEKIKEADLITITAGGNDMMAPLYGKIAALYNTYWAGANYPQISGNQITTIFGPDSDIFVNIIGLLNAAMLALVGPDYANADVPADVIAASKAYTDSDEFAAALEAYKTSLGSVLDYLYEANPDAVIVISTQYNPYEAFAGGGSFVGVLYDAMAVGAPMLNSAIADVADAYANVHVAEGVYSEFAASETNLCNAYYVPPFSFDLDFHPNAAGHAVIADEIISLLHGAGFGSGSAGEGSGDGSVPAPPAVEELCVIVYCVEEDTYHHFYSEMGGDGTELGNPVPADAVTVGTVAEGQDGIYTCPVTIKLTDGMLASIREDSGKNHYIDEDLPSECTWTYFWNPEWEYWYLMIEDETEPYPDMMDGIPLLYTTCEVTVTVVDNPGGVPGAVYYVVAEYNVTYTDGVEDEVIFPDQKHSVFYYTKTPDFEGTPTREGYIFAGWSPAVAERVTGNTVYTAQWTEAEVELPEDAVKVPLDESLLRSVKLVARSQISAAQGKTAVKVTWQAPEAVKLDGYEVYRSTERYRGYGTDPFFETGRDSYWNTSIKRGETYYYKVRGYVEAEDGSRYYTDWSQKAIRTVPEI